MENFFESRTFRSYYDDLGKHKLLTAQRERELLIRYKSCPKCRKRLPHLIKVSNCPTCGCPTPKRVTGKAINCVECNARFDAFAPPIYCVFCGSPRDQVAREELIVAKKLSKSPEIIQKLISAGNVGLLISLDKFDMARATRFLTYASWWIRKEMLDELHASGLVHVPSHKQKSVKKSQKLGSYECIHCGVRTDNPLRTMLPKCIPIKRKRRMHDFILVNAEEITTMSSIVPIEEAMNRPSADDNIEDLTISNDSAVLLRQVLNVMPIRARDRYILLQYYNIAQDERKTDPKTLPQLASLTGVTVERVRQIKLAVLKHLRRQLVEKCIAVEAG
jgi:RNA polymerase primary sigma factor